MIVCLGDLMLDIIVDRRVVQDGMPSGIYVRPGGSGANTAVWAKRSGIEAAWNGVVAADQAAEVLVQSLKDEDVVVSVTRIPGGESGVVLSWLGRSAHRTMHSARSVASLIGPQHVDVELIRRARAVHITGYLLTTPGGLDAASLALEEGRKANCVLSFDASSPFVIRTIGVERLKEIFRHFQVDILLANRSEAAELTGILSARESAVALTPLTRIAIVKDGGHGSYLAQEGRCVFTKSNRVKPIDTTGAGDAFGGTWLGSFLQHGDTTRASETASRVAATAIQSIGARPSLRSGVESLGTP